MLISEVWHLTYILYQVGDSSPPLLSKVAPAAPTPVLQCNIIMGPHFSKSNQASGLIRHEI
jgi:hypothetical protein